MFRVRSSNASFVLSRNSFRGGTAVAAAPVIGPPAAPPQRPFLLPPASPSPLSFSSLRRLLSCSSALSEGALREVLDFREVVENREILQSFPTTAATTMGSLYIPDDPVVDLMEQTKRRTLTPLPVPRVSDLPKFDGLHKERLFWGTYRPFCYYGIRSRAPQSLIAGLAWSSVQDGKPALRHYCDINDDMTKYSWVRHDGSSYGRQVLVDNGLVVTTHFLKSAEHGSGYGGDWVARIKVEAENETLPVTETQRKTQSIFFYVAEESGTEVKVWPKDHITSSCQEGEDGGALPFASGSSDMIGDWQLHADYKGEGVTMNYAGLQHYSMATLSHVFQETLDAQGNSRLPDTSAKNSNIGVIQLTGSLPFEADLVFVSGVRNESAEVQSRVENLTGAALDKRIALKELAFEERFHNTFELHEKVEGEKELETARVALSNMLGGMGYFYGQSRVAIPTAFRDDTTKVSDHWEYWPSSLYTAVPSRSVFPRGFLWDEGFHQLLVSRWDRDMSMEILANWLDLVNVEGWIPRELILGEEALSKVPALYINQYTDNANPPALMLVLKFLAEKYESEKKKGLATKADAEFFKAVFPRLDVWFNWFLTSQIGKEPDTYYWHGRDADTDVELNPKCLTSGLDDYPRASHPTDDERHVDLRCWIAFAANCMSLFARLSGAPTEKYDKMFTELSNLNRLNELHYDTETGRYVDYGFHSENIELRWKNIENPVTGLPERVLRREVLEPPKLGWIPQFGLNSLFPFLMRLIPNDSSILGDHLKMLESPDLLWTDYGLRSLATSSSIYMKYNSEFEAPYWRGPVWININYLVLSALYRYSEDTGPYSNQAADLYQKFRYNLIRNIVQRFHETGYIWENYDNAAQGKGQGAHPFTGWSALIVLIMGEQYL
ncbi:unnamed protein product [Calypogeia fissa]